MPLKQPVEKTEAYHRAAISYNEQFVDFAATVANGVEHEEVRRWCLAISRQHEYHATKHRAALDRMMNKHIEAAEELLDEPAPVVGTTSDTLDAQALFAQAQADAEAAKTGVDA